MYHSYDQAAEPGKIVTGNAQPARISTCILKSFCEDDEQEGWARGAIVTSDLRFTMPEDMQSRRIRTLACGGTA
jgi:hypothetical protein